MAILSVLILFHREVQLEMPPKGKKGKSEKKTKEKEEILRPSEKETILQAE